MDILALLLYQAVRLYGTGYPVAQITEITGCSRTSLLDWCRLYRAHGGGLVDGRLGGNRAKLTFDQREAVRAHLHQYTPRQLFGPETATPDGQFWTVPDLKRAVQNWFGVSWSSPSSYLTLLADCGSATSVPRRSSNRAPSATSSPSRNNSIKLIDIAQDAPETVILAEDEASLYLQATLMRV